MKEKSQEERAEIVWSFVVPSCEENGGEGEGEAERARESVFGDRLGAERPRGSIRAVALRLCLGLGPPSHSPLLLAGRPSSSAAI